MSFKDFRQEGAPADIGTYEFGASALVFQFTFSGSTYYATIRSGMKGWIPLSVGTNAVTVIQAAINALTSGGTVFINSSTYSLSAPIAISTDNITIRGEYRGTILTMPTNQRVINITGSDAIITDLSISAPLPNTNYGIAVSGQRCIIERCYMTGSYANVFLLPNSNYNAIRNNHFYSSGNNHIFANDSSYNTITGNYLSCCGDYSIGVMWSSGPCGYNLIAHNKIDASQGAVFGGIAVWSEYDQIMDNTIINTTGFGINLGLATVPQHDLVSGNTIVNGGNQAGIQLTNGSSNNLIINNKIKGTTAIGIWVRHAACNGNRIYINDLTGLATPITDIGINTIIRANPGYAVELGILPFSSGIVGNYYDPLTSSTSFGTHDGLGNKLVCQLLLVQGRKRFDQLAFEDMYNDPTHHFRAGIYRVDKNLYPTSLIVDAGEVTANASLHELAINQTRENTVLGLAITADHNDPELRWFQVGWTSSGLMGQTTFNPGGGPDPDAWIVNNPYGALPATYPVGAIRAGAPGLPWGHFMKLRIAEILD